MQAFIILGLAAFAAAVPTQFPVPSVGGEPYIIGGEEADIADFPYQCNLRFTGSLTCGCVIAGATKVLTAAHCTDGRPVGSFTVHAGSSNRLSGGVVIQVSVKDEHEDYNNGACTFCNDIGMLTLVSGLDLSDPNIGTIDRHPQDDNFAGETCTLSGWGRTGTSNILPNMLQKVDMDVIENDECQTRMNPVAGANVGIEHICIYSVTEDRGSCNGDSGGPMTCTRDGPVLAGITSWGVSSLGNCLQSYPSVYVRVSTFREWIDDRMTM